MSAETKHLILDAGNTQLKAAFFVDGELQRVHRIPNAEAMAGLQQAASWSPEAVIFGSVAALRIHDVRDQFDCPVIHFKPGITLPITLDYSTPETLGADRLANVCGSRKLHGTKDQLVIDIGTCVTFDLLEGGTKYLGGAISPGMRLRNQAMNDFTARLPLVETIPNPPLTGKTTEGSLQAGIFHGLLDEMEGRINRYKEEYPELVVVITGGDSVYFEKAFKSSIFAHLNLTLLGLHEILLHQLEISRAGA